MSSNDARPRAPRPYRLSLHWDPRAQSVVSYATALWDFAQGLSRESEVLAKWFVREPSGAMPLSDDQVERLRLALEANPRSWEFNGTSYTAHEVVLTNARVRAKKCAIYLICGIEVPTTALWFSNHLDLEFSGPSEAFADLDAVERLLALAIDDFSPAWASVSTPATPDRSLEGIYRGAPQVGWYTAFAPDYGLPGPLPEGASLEVRPDAWAIVRAVPDWFDERNPDHMKQLEMTRTALSQSGMLRDRI